MNELKELLNSVEDTYDDFVLGVCHYVRMKPERLEKVLNYIKSNPEALSSDIILFISMQSDFMEDASYDMSFMSVG
jgi:hypothetical protein